MPEITKPEEKKSKTNLGLVIVLSLLGVFITLGVLVGAFFLGKSIFNQTKSTSTSVSQTAGYTQDQKKVIEAFGLPDAFKIVNASDKRVETWYYQNLNEVFAFNNGQFLARSHYDYQLPNKVQAISLAPKDFYSAQKLNDVVRVVGFEPSLTGEINDSALDNAQIANFDNLLVVGTQDDKVVFVETRSVYDQSAKNSKVTQAPPTTSQDNPATTSGEIDNQTETDAENTLVMPSDNRFSINAGVLAKEMTVSFDDDTGYAKREYNFCVPVSNEDDEDFFCDGQGTPAFIITAYTPKQLANQQASPYWGEGNEQIITTNADGLTYTLSHPNGFVPDEIAGRADDYYQSVIESFSF